MMAFTVSSVCMKVLQVCSKMKEEVKFKFVMFYFTVSVSTRLNLNIFSCGNRVLFTPCDNV